MQGPQELHELGLKRLAAYLATRAQLTWHFKYMQLPAEFGEKVVKLKRWLYGMRKAANRWEEHYTNKFKVAGFLPGVASPVVFYNPATGVRCVVHGDDFIFSGKHRQLEKIRVWMEGWCEIKFRGIMGSGSGDVKEREILGRTLRWTEEGLEFEADEKTSENPDDGVRSGGGLELRGSAHDHVGARWVGPG